MFDAVKIKGGTGTVHIDDPDIGGAGDFTACGIYIHKRKGFITYKRGEFEHLGRLSKFDRKVVTCKRCIRFLKAKGALPK
jgi:hypothetical protein